MTLSQIPHYIPFPSSVAQRLEPTVSQLLAPNPSVQTKHNSQSQPAAKHLFLQGQHKSLKAQTYIPEFITKPGCVTFMF